MNDETKFNSSLLFPETNSKLSFWLILRIDAVNKDYIGYLLIPITGVTITEINMQMNEPSSCSKASSGGWALLLKLAHSFPAKRDRHNQPGKAVQ